ncbi:hypothetical protein MHY85_05135 [Cellulomonas sp. ACRRI]|nr:hypothetical protein [Cellulomonas sp. ACRRI]MCG7285359.1 hypothetical protein [Cellulomonas sp. ACRRI]
MFDITTALGRAQQAAADDISVSSGVSMDEAERIVAAVVAQFRLSAVMA